MNEKVALIAGASGGIGSAIARLFSGKGMKVYGNYFKNQEKAGQMEREIERCIMAQCDLADERQARQWVEQVFQKESRIDVFVNAVTAPLKLKNLEDLSAEEFEEDYSVIVRGGFHLLKSVIPLMKKQKEGVVIHLLTSAVKETPPRMSSYAAAKSGLLGLTQSLSAEAGRFNVRILGLSPSFVETDLLKAFPPKLLEMERQKMPGGQLIQAGEIAQVALEMVQNPEKFPNGSHYFVSSPQAIPDVK